MGSWDGRRWWTVASLFSFAALVLAIWALVAAVTVAAPPATASQVADSPEIGRPMGPQAPLIVLDPGHGGSNAGAPTVDPGVHEKHVTLALARLTAAELRNRGFRVALTRDDDRYLSLRHRSTLANRLGADLFISIHGNASTSRSQMGFETYLLSKTAVDIDAPALRREGGPKRHQHGGDHAPVLDDIVRGLSQAPSAQLAAAIQEQLAEVREASENRGVRQAAMDVLYGATMPAVLVEVGFVDHPIEGHEILDSQVQKGIASALATAIVDQLSGSQPLG